MNNRCEELKNRIKEEMQLIKEHELKLNQLKDEMDKVVQEEKNSNKIPFKEEERYYCVGSNGIYSYTWGRDKLDYWQLNQNNAFKTKQEAKDKLFQLELEGKAREFRRINNCNVSEEEWNDLEKCKFAIDCYGDINTEYPIAYYILRERINADSLGFFNSREMIEKFIEENVKDLIKYFKIARKLGN